MDTKITSMPGTEEDLVTAFNSPHTYIKGAVQAQRGLLGAAQKIKGKAAKQEKAANQFKFMEKID